MIEAFTKAWFANLHTMREKFSKKQPDDYEEVVRSVVEMLAGSLDEYDSPDPSRIHEINDGDYQGTLVYVIGSGGYQPSKYWYVKVSYGSCSGCDTLEALRGYDDRPPDDEQIRGYMTLALHIVQGLRQMGDSDA
jgi:hypothetical protein